jgi:hypothetical protein
MSLHASGVASPEGCRELSPGWSVFCDTRGFEYMRKPHPGRGAGIICPFMPIRRLRVSKRDSAGSDPNMMQMESVVVSDFLMPAVLVSLFREA